MGAKADVLDTVRRWDRMRQERLRVEADRNGCRCEVEDDGDPSVGDSGTPACFKMAVYDALGWPTGHQAVDDPMALDEFCDTCRLRNILHVVRLRLARREGAALRRLKALAPRLRMNP